MFPYVGVRSHSASKIFEHAQNSLTFANTVRRRFLCMHKKVRRSPTNCQYAEGSFTKRNVTERNSKGLVVSSATTVRKFNCSIRPTKLRYFERIQNSLAFRLEINYSKTYKAVLLSNKVKFCN